MQFRFFFAHMYAVVTYYCQNDQQPPVMTFIKLISSYMTVMREKMAVKDAQSGEEKKRSETDNTLALLYFDNANVQ